MTVYSISIRKPSLVPFMLAVTVFAIALLSGTVGIADPQAPRASSRSMARGRSLPAPDQQPAQFDRTIPVPGVVDMATPPFENVGRNTKFADDGGHKFIMIPDPHYRVFWYRRTFSVDGEVPPVAVLKLAKAKFGTRVWLNGHDLGKHWPCFTPGYFDVRKHLKGDGQSNELIVCVNADPLAVGDRVANGFDFEKRSYLAGIYDDVTLTLTGSPFVVNVQVVPEIDQSTVRVVAELRNTSDRGGGDRRRVRSPAVQQSQVVGQVKLPACVSTRTNPQRGGPHPDPRLQALDTRDSQPLSPRHAYQLRCVTDSLRHASVSLRSADGDRRSERQALLLCVARTSATSVSRKIRFEPTSRGTSNGSARCTGDSNRCT